jgi:hypothetical protein
MSTDPEVAIVISVGGMGEAAKAYIGSYDPKSGPIVSGPVINNIPKENATSVVLQIAGWVSALFGRREPPVPSPVEEEMLRHDPPMVSLLKASALIGVPVDEILDNARVPKLKFSMQSASGAKSPTTLWVEKSLVDRWARERTGSFDARPPRPDPAVVRQRALDQIVSEGAFGPEDMSKPPDFHEWQSGNRAPNTETSAPVAITTAKVQAAAESRS